MDINEIARRAGVSRATVSRYLNDGYVSEEKRALISRIIEETGYVPSSRARQLRTGKSGLIAVIIPKINSQSVSRMVAGITETICVEDREVLLFNTANHEELEVSYLERNCHRKMVDGVILIATIITPAHEAALSALQIPHVILGQRLEDHPCVFHDDYHAVFDITKHMAKSARVAGYLGVTERDVSAGKMRHQGFVDACREAGVRTPDEAQVTGDFTVDSGYLCCEQIMDAVPEVDTIVCATDTMAYGAITCLREYGRRVPEDVQVSGIGDSDLSRILMPSVTSAHLYYKTSGIAAAQMLITAISEPEKKPAIQELRMGYEIYARNSTR